jgi:hypothetical protein
MASEITDVMNNSAISVKRRIVPPYILDAHVKTLKNLKTASLESYCHGFILADLNKSGFCICIKVILSSGIALVNGQPAPLHGFGFIFGYAFSIFEIAF